MATIHYYEIYSENPMTQPPVLVALEELRRLRWNQENGKRLRTLTKQINEHIEEIGEERKRLLLVHANRGPDGEPVTVKSWNDLKEPKLFQADFQAFLNETFEIAGLPLSAVPEQSNLLGETWSSPLLEDAPVEKKEEAPAADDGGGSSGSGAADN